MTYKYNPFWQQRIRETVRHALSVPRASGDKPEKLLLCSTDALCSPRQRG